MSEIGALIIRLQADTAQFRDDMGKVKKDLSDLQDPANAAGKAIDGSMTQARYGLMLTESVVGVRLPRALNTLLAGIGPVGSAFSMMLPLLGVAAAIAIITKLIEKHDEMKDQAAATRSAYAEFASSAAASLRGLQTELLQAGMKSDELRGNHLAALGKELQIIDNQTLTKLIGEFDKLADHADKVFADMRAQESFFQIGSEANEAQTALKEFKDNYDLAIAEGNKAGAQKLLDDFTNTVTAKLENAKKVSTELKEMSRDAGAAEGGLDMPGDQEDSDSTKERIQAWSLLVDVVKAYGKEKSVVNQIDATQKDNSKVEYALKEQEMLDRIYEDGLDETKMLARQDLEEFEKTQREKLRGIKALQEAATRAAEEQLRDAAAKLSQQSEMQKAATSAEKDSLQNAVTLGLMNRRQELEAEKTIIAEELKAKQDSLMAEVAAKKAAIEAEIAADNLAANKQQAAGVNKGDQGYIDYLDQAKIKQDELNAIVQKFGADWNIAGSQANTQMAQLDAQLTKLHSSWGLYFQNMKTETLDLSTQIRTTLQSAVTSFTNSFSSAMAKSIVENKNLGQAVRQEAAQMLESMLSSIIKWGLQWVLTHTLMRLTSTATAAQQTATTAASVDTQKGLAASLAGTNAVASYSLAPWPIDMGAPAFGAAMMATAMSFEVGGKIPGQGAVPIIGHGGETVVTKALTDRVEASERGGGSGLHMSNVFAPQVHALDAEGVDRVLTKHGTTFRRHVEAQIRRMNR